MPTLATNLWTQDFPFFDFPHALISAAGFLWIGNESNTGSLIRVDPNNHAAWTSLTFPNDVWHQWVVDVLYIPSKNKIYCLMGTPNASNGFTTVSEVDPTTLAFTDVIQTSAWNVEQGSFACDGTYLYIISRQNPVVHKYRISDWTEVATLDTGMSFSHCARIDGGKLYVTSSSGTNDLLSVVEITLASFTVTQSVVINHDRVFTDDMAITSDYLWLGSEASGNIVRVSRSNFNIQLVINTGIAARNFGVYYDGDGIWTGWEGNPGIFGRLNVSTLNLQLFQFTDTNQISPNEFLRIGNVMYFTHYHINGTLTAIGVAGSIPDTPAAILITDRLSFFDTIGTLGQDPNGIFFLDSINLVDQVSCSRVQGTPNTDTVSLSDAIRISYLGDYDQSDSISLGETFGVWNTTYYEILSLTDTTAYSLDLPAATDIPLSVGDSFDLFDGLQETDPNGFVLVGDAITFRDNQGVIENSTLDGYLRRYLNDVRR